MRTKRRVLGQHFLNSTVFAERIAQAVRIKNRVVLEIGSGKGMLTRQLARRANMVVSVEIDGRLADRLRKLNLPGVQVLNADFLKISMEDWGKIVVIGNIPYSITSAIVRKLAENKEFLEHAVLTVQREYAARMTAVVGKSEYGHISIFTQHHFEVQKEFNIPPRFFSPRPQVSSAVISLNPRTTKYDTAYEARFFEFVAGVFRYRRKSVKNAILNYQQYLPADLDDRILASRPQHLSLEDFHAIFQRVTSS